MIQKRMKLVFVVLFTFFITIRGATFTSEGGILKVNGSPFVMKGVSWFGFETNLNVFHGLWAVDYHFLFQFLQNNGFNAMRVPFNLDMVLNNPNPTSISYGYCGNNISCNIDLKGLTSLQVLQKMISTAAGYGIAIMLDLHSFEPDAYAQNGLWYDSSHPVSTVLKGWDILISMFKTSPNLMAVDLKNEPFACTWNKGIPATDWQPAAEMLGNHVLGQTDWLIFVEGVASDPPCAQPCFYGGDLIGAANNPVILSKPAKLVYSPHCYGPSVYNQPYFSAPNFPQNMPPIWDAHFGYLRNQSAAVVTGEWGGQMSGADQVWMDAWVNYLSQKQMTNQFFWCLNPDSGDTGGLLLYDWITPVTSKLQLLQKLVPNPTKLSF